MLGAARVRDDRRAGARGDGGDGGEVQQLTLFAHSTESFDSRMRHLAREWAASERIESETQRAAYQRDLLIQAYKAALAEGLSVDEAVANVRRYLPVDGAGAAS